MVHKNLKKMHALFCDRKDQYNISHFLKKYTRKFFKKESALIYLKAYSSSCEKIS